MHILPWSACLKLNFCNAMHLHVWMHLENCSYCTGIMDPLLWEHVCMEFTIISVLLLYEAVPKINDPAASLVRHHDL